MLAAADGFACSGPTLMKSPQGNDECFLAGS